MKLFQVTFVLVCEQPYNTQPFEIFIVTEPKIVTCVFNIFFQNNKKKRDEK